MGIGFIWNQKAKPQNMSQGLFKFMTEQLLAIDAQCMLIAVNCAGAMHPAQFTAMSGHCASIARSFPVMNLKRP